MTKLFTDDERADWIRFCNEVAEEFGIDHGDYGKLSDEELDKEADWYFYLTGK